MIQRKFFHLLYLLLLVLVSACTETTSPQPPETTLELINLQIEPAIEHWLPKVSFCANQIQNFGIHTQVLPQPMLDPDDADLVLRLGERLETDPNVAIMGVEELVVVAGNQVPVSSISLETLQAIFSGEIVSWGSVTGSAPSGDQVNQPIVTISYPDRHGLRVLFEASYLDNQTISSNPYIMSTNDYLQTFLLANPYAIGYALKSQLSSAVKTLTITNFEIETAKHFVLAVTAEEPEGALKQFLLCLQNSQ